MKTKIPYTKLPAGWAYSHKPGLEIDVIYEDPSQACHSKKIRKWAKENNLTIKEDWGSQVLLINKTDHKACAIWAERIRKELLAFWKAWPDYLECSKATDILGDIHDRLDAEGFQ